MKVLAVDTSSLVAAVAVAEDEKILGEYLTNQKKTHSQLLMPMIDELLGNLGMEPGDMDIFAASTGPGSFTGLRIGVTTIKAMAYAAGKPVIGVPTLDALAFNLFPAGQYLVCPIMDARNNQVYTAVYENEVLMPRRLTDYMGIPVPELVDILMPMGKKVIFNGDGIVIHKGYLKERLGDRCEFMSPGLVLQRASSVAGLALIMAGSGLTESSFDLVPFYLRKSQAEREREKQLRVES